MHTLASAFDEEMLRIYQRSRSEAKYNPKYFFQMLQLHRGVKTARILINDCTVSEGFTAMWERGRLDLTVEATILDNPRWHPLFADDEIAACRKRLSDYKYYEKAR